VKRDNIILAVVVVEELHGITSSRVCVVQVYKVCVLLSLSLSCWVHI
jgi:hypothetical protein